MFQNVFLLPCVTTLLYILIRTIELYATKQEEYKIPLKLIIRDSFLVFLCTMVANSIMMIFHGHIHQLMNIVTETKSVLPEGPPNVFTDVPAF
jgi:hypothetical protein